MSCTDTAAHEALEALFLGTLAPERLGPLRAHVATCASCRARYDALGRVESALERRALPRSREAALERALMERLAPQRLAHHAPPSRARWSLAGWLRVAVPVAALAGLALLVLPRLRSRDEEQTWGARGGGSAARAYGVRAFCVSAQGQVLGEAAPGGTLRCAAGNSVQFSYTAPAAVALSIEAAGEGGEPLRFFPREGEAGQLPAAVDAPLPFSTPVTREWLRGALPVRVRFAGPDGAERARGELTLAP